MPSLISTSEGILFPRPLQKAILPRRYLPQLIPHLSQSEYDGLNQMPFFLQYLLPVTKKDRSRMLLPKKKKKCQCRIIKPALFMPIKYDTDKKRIRKAKNLHKNSSWQ